MKILRTFVLVATLALPSLRASATVHYVDVNSTHPTLPYTSWANAATNIQDAVQFSSPGDLVLVTNGVYEFGGSALSGSNRVTISSAITLQSVNGPEVTIIKGYQVPGTTNGPTAVRCVYLGSGARLSGFTLTSGATQTSGQVNGGGVLCQSLSSLVTNCVIAGNACSQNGGGAYSGKLIDCVITGNTSTSGGGAYFSTLINCAVSTNSSGTGGGVYGSSGLGTLVNCTLSGNTSAAGGGAFTCTLINCTLIGNSASVGAGGAQSGNLTNCLLTGNFSGNVGGGSQAATLVNCTLSGNSATSGGGGAAGGMLLNCIVYDNHNPNPTYNNYAGGTSLTNCCTTPLPGAGSNNTTLPPLFVDPAAGDFHLLSSSPCINAGMTSSITVSNDLDGNPRIIGSTADIGAYEYQYQSTGTFFVNVSNTQPAFPFQTWDTAATNIQDAIDAASAGSQILVTNGVYRAGGRAVYGSLTNRVAATRSLAIQSVNGASVTFIEGFQIPGTTNGNSAIRCAYLTNGVVLDGFTLTNGATRTSAGLTNEQNGGGIYCESANVLIRNCIFSRNAAYGYGGGIYSGTLTDCTITGNQSSQTGGGAGFSTLDHCTISRNTAGGIIFGTLTDCTVTDNRDYGVSHSTCDRCTISRNYSSSSGAGVVWSFLNNSLISSNTSIYPGAGASSSTLNNCILVGNSITNSTYEGGGASGSTLNNCLLFGNKCQGNGGGVSSSRLTGCTIVGNSAGQRGGGVYQGSLYNCIVYFNTAQVQGSNYYNPATINNCCTLPATDAGCITNAPQFVDLVGGDFHLLPTSPCINGGYNVYVTNSTDFDGNLRIVGGAVDIGAYEFQNPGLTLPFLWSQQFSLSTTDGSLDSDGDGLNNWQEWRAGTTPTDATSTLRLLSISNSPAGATVTWQSVSNVTYSLQTSTDLSTQPAFSTIQSNLIGQSGTTTYTDPTPTPNGSHFYRIAVQ